MFALGTLVAAVSTAQVPPGAIAIENVRIFNGTAGQLSAPSSMLVVGNVIKTIATGTIVDPPGM